MGYWVYYLMTFALAYASRYPYAAGIVVVIYLARDFLPDPVIWARTATRIRNLRTTLAANPANATARRDLAMLYLERLRPRTALEVIDAPGLGAVGAEDPELLYLKGLACVRARRWEHAIDPLVTAVQKNPKVRLGEPFRAAADALLALGKHEEAEDALLRYIHFNSSSVESWVKLARARRAQGLPREAREALDEAAATFRVLPWFAKRKAFGWWVQALVVRAMGPSKDELPPSSRTKPPSSRFG
jgi:tetratricopeptide (TPR) repeat protein